MKGMPRVFRPSMMELSSAVAQQEVDDGRIHVVRSQIGQGVPIGRLEAFRGGSDVLELEVIVHRDDRIVLDDEHAFAL